MMVMNAKTNHLEEDISFKLLPVKPIGIINKLMDYFYPEARPLLGRYGDDEVRLNDSTQGFVVVLILEGSIDIWRIHDQLLVATATAPAILGMQGTEFRYQTHVFRRSAKSNVYVLSFTQAIEIIRKNDLIGEVLSYQAYLNDQQAYRDFLMVNKSSYEIICMLLIQLARDPEHKKISIEKYILSRTGLARSGVMKILASLRYGEFIEIKNGKLIQVNLPFPKNY